MQNYLKTDNIEIINEERKVICQLQTRMNYRIKTHFRNMHEHTICDGCKIEESTTKHTLDQALRFCGFCCSGIKKGESKKKL